MTAIRDIMRTDTSTLSPSDSVGKAIAVMHRMKTNHLLVEEKGEIKGVAGSRALIGYPHSRLITDCPLEPITAMPMETPLEEALKTSEETEAGLVLLLDKDGKPVGTIDRETIISAICDDLRKLHEQAEQQVAAQKHAEKRQTELLEERAWRIALERSSADLEKRARKLADSRTAMIHMLKDLDKTSKDLAAAKDYTENIIKSMIDTLIVVDPDGNIRTINKATSDLLGYKEKELVGSPAAILFAEKKDTPLEGTRMKKLIEEGSIRDFDMIYRTKSGEAIPVSFSGAVMYETSAGETSFMKREVSDASLVEPGQAPSFAKASAGKSEGRRDTKHERQIIGIVGIARDMREAKRLIQKEKELAVTTAAAETEHRRAAELEKAYDELRNTQQKLVQSEKLASVGRLAAGAAHEINNPLASILLGAQRIRDKIKSLAADIPDSQDYLRTLERIERATKRSHGIVTGLLAFSRPTELESSPANINKVIEEALESLEDQVKAQNIKVFTEFARDLPMIKADAHKLSEVFNNLIINACDAMSKGGKLKIATRLREPGAEPVNGGPGKGGKTVEIEFTDTGEGISDEDMGSIFDPFFTTKETGKGVGLGLSISYSIVEAHRGAIDVKSQKGKGAAFTVRLPVVA